MRCLLFLSILSFVSANSDTDDVNLEQGLFGNNFTMDNVTYDAMIKLMGGVLSEVIKHFPEGQNDTTISLNNYVDKGLETFRDTFKKYNFSRLDLADAHIELSPVGHMDLSKGLLNEFASVARNGEVNVTYNQTDKKVTLSLPFTFRKLKFSYRYNTRVTLMNVEGRITGFVKDASFYIKTFFDFVTRKLILDQLDFVSLGDLNLKFSGHGMMDWMINSMTKAAGGILQPLIINEVTDNLKTSLKQFLNDLNKEIAKRYYDYHE